MSSPLQVNKRPFSVEPITGIMLPDGIFDTAIRRQLISVYVANSSDITVVKFWARIRDTSDYTVIGVRQIEVLQPLVSGATTLLQWEVTFRGATPGKKSLNIEFGGMSTDTSGTDLFWDGYSEAVYFLSSTSYDPQTRQYTCRVPEGSLQIAFNNSMQSPSSQYQNAEGPIPAIQFPQRFTATVMPTGLSIPFDDPWWKVLAWIVAALAGLAAVIAAKEGNGVAEIGIGGHDHDHPYEYDWCVPDPAALGRDNFTTPAGILSSIANAAILVALADDADPWERGRIAAALKGGEVPIKETVEVDLTYPDEMKAGTGFEVGARWSYRAELSSGRVVTFNVDETQTNTHLVNWDIDAPKEVLQREPLVVRLRGTKPSGEVFTGDQLYAFALFITPDGQRSFRIPLLDDGGKHDTVASDGWYSAGIVIEELLSQTSFDPLGEWRVQFVAQDVNDATPDMPPKIAATHVGGALLLAPISATKTNGSACTVAEIIRIVVKKL